MPGKNKKKIESDDSESQPLIRGGTKKIQKPKPKQQQITKHPKGTHQKIQKPVQKTKAKQSNPKQKQPETKPKDDKKNNYLPGQRHPTPPDTDGAKAFYLSLLEQCPNNAMAEKWCLDYGCLDYADAVQRVKKFEKSKR